MKTKFNVKVLYKNQLHQKIQSYDRDGLKEYGFNQGNSMVYFVEKVKIEDSMSYQENIFWIPIADILDMDIQMIKTFETKKEMFEFNSSQNK